MHIIYSFWHLTRFVDSVSDWKHSDFRCGKFSKACQKIRKKEENNKSTIYNEFDKCNDAVFSVTS